MDRRSENSTIRATFAICQTVLALTCLTILWEAEQPDRRGASSALSAHKSNTFTACYVSKMLTNEIMSAEAGQRCGHPYDKNSLFVLARQGVETVFPPCYCSFEFEL